MKNRSNYEISTTKHYKYLGYWTRLHWTTLVPTRFVASRLLGTITYTNQTTQTDHQQTEQLCSTHCASSTQLFWSVCRAADCRSKVCSFGQWTCVADNCAVLPTASAGQYATSHSTPLLFWFPWKLQYINVWWTFKLEFAKKLQCGNKQTTTTA